MLLFGAVFLGDSFGICWVRGSRPCLLAVSSVVHVPTVSQSNNLRLVVSNGEVSLGRTPITWSLPSKHLGPYIGISTTTMTPDHFFESEELVSNPGKRASASFAMSSATSSSSPHPELSEDVRLKLRDFGVYAFNFADRQKRSDEARRTPVEGLLDRRGCKDRISVPDVDARYKAETVQRKATVRAYLVMFLRALDGNGESPSQNVKRNWDMTIKIKHIL